MAVVIRSARQLAKLVGRSHAAVAKWVKRPDWPFGAGPWAGDQLPAIQKWASSLQEDYSAASRSDADPVPVAAAPAAKSPADELQSLSVEKKLKLKLVAARVNKLEAELKQFTGDYVSRKDMEHEFVKRILACKSELLNTARLLASMEPYLNPSDLAMAEEAIRQWVKGICDRFSGQVDDPEENT